MDVVVESTGNGADAIATSDLVVIELFPAHRCLQLLRNEEIAALDVPAARIEIGEPGCDTVDRAAIHVFGEIFADQIKGPNVQPGVEAPPRSFVRPGEDKRREGAVLIDLEVQRLRDICARIVAAIKNVGAKL